MREKEIQRIVWWHRKMEEGKVNIENKKCKKKKGV